MRHLDPDEIGKQLRLMFDAEPNALSGTQLDEAIGAIIARGRPTSRHFGLAQWSGRTSRRWINVTALSVGLVACIALALAVALPRGVVPTASVLYRTLSSYPLDDSPAAAAAYVGNDLVLLGRVVGVQSSRWSSADHDIGHIYTPIVIDVETVVRGSFTPDQMTVQSLGGTIDGVQMVFTDSPDLSSLRSGTELLLFLSSREPGSGVPRTPNMTYVVDEGIARSLMSSDHHIGLEDFLALVRGS